VGCTDQEIGPGAYVSNRGISPKPLTACFKSTRKDNLFSGNQNPAPGSYNDLSQDAGKNWQSNIGAFGCTERRFASVGPNDQPGPGEYTNKN
jgi:hypothetical protein